MSLTYANIFNSQRREVSDANEALSLSKMQIDRGDGFLVRPWGILIPGSDWNISDVQPTTGLQPGAQFVDTSTWTLDNLLFNGKPLRAWFEQQPLQVSPGFQGDPSTTQPVSAFSQAAYRQTLTATPISETEDAPLIRAEGLSNLPLIALGIAGILFLSSKAKRA